MTDFIMRNAPKGWIYPFTKKDVKDFVLALGAEFETVEFEGTRDADDRSAEMSCCCGVVTSEQVDDSWTFSMEINCFNEEQFGSYQKQIKKELLIKIWEWVKAKLKLPSNYTKSPKQLFLKFEIKNENCVATCFEVD